MTPWIEYDGARDGLILGLVINTNRRAVWPHCKNSERSTDVLIGKNSLSVTNADCCFVVTRKYETKSLILIYSSIGVMGAE